MLKEGFTIAVLISTILGLAQNSATIDVATKPQLEFVPNGGQWHPAVRYKADIPYGHLILESDALHYVLARSEDYNRISKWQHDHPSEIRKDSMALHNVRMRFIGMDLAPILETKHQQKHYYNFFLGNDSRQWASKLHPVTQVNYKEVYPDVNLEILTQNGLKYQWVIAHPTTEKVAKIKIVIEGATRILLENGEVKIQTTAGNITDRNLLVYQQLDDTVVEINAHYVLKDSILSYEILGDINPNYPLVIDPELIFSTYSGATGDNFGYTATYDSKANLYAGGIVKVIPSLNEQYPVTSGAFDETFNNGTGRWPCDVSISKYDSAGSQLLWATYLGGSDNEYPHSLVVDRNDDLVILGSTSSSNFAVDKLAFQTKLGGRADIFVSKLSEDGTTLLGSTYVGGNRDDGLNKHVGLLNFYADDYRGDVITDDDNHIFVATTTLSDTLPAVNAFQPTKNTSYDGYIFELSPDMRTMEWATYLGGNGGDAFYSIKLDQANIYIGGGTTSTDLPTTDSSVGPTAFGNTDGVLAIIDKRTKQLKRLTYWGTDKYDQIYFIDTDEQGRLYATGQTAGNITKTQNVYGENSKGQFIFRIDTLLQNQDFVTTFGNKNNEPNLAPSAFLVDVCGHIYFSGWGSTKSSLNSGSTANLQTTPDAVQPKTDNNDFYILVLGQDAETILYATYFGGDSTADHVDGGTSRFDKRGVIYQSVCSSCPADDDDAVNTREINDFPTTSGAAFEVNSSVRCSNASFKIDLQIRSAVIADFVATPTLGCAPLDVQFTSLSIMGRTFFWEFGDGDTSHQLDPLHTFTEPGVYTVKLTVIDSATCNIISTYQRSVEVLGQGVAQFSARFDGCNNKLTIENQSEGGFSYRWDFGDGDTSNAQDPEHDYDEIGNYTIQLFVNENTLCSDQISKEVSIEAAKKHTINLYNVFTPNGDGLNDCFKMDGDFLECKDFLLEIYNRWGELVFSTPNPNECWYGNDMKRKAVLPSSTYYYLLYLGKNATVPISGTVDLIKD